MQVIGFIHIPSIVLGLEMFHYLVKRILKSRENKSERGEKIRWLRQDKLDWVHFPIPCGDYAHA